jgi:class 3 adenylate cyclase
MSQADEFRTVERSVVVVDMVGYGPAAKYVEEMIGQVGPRELNKQIHQLIGTALKDVRIDREGVYYEKRGDGAAIALQNARDASRFAEALQREANAENIAKSMLLAQRHFRVGICTGEVGLPLSLADGSEMTGNTLVTAVRLESACQPGGVMICQRTWDDLDDELRRPYAQCEVKDKHGQSLKAFHRQVAPPRPVPPPTANEVARRLMPQVAVFVLLFLLFLLTLFAAQWREKRWLLLAGSGVPCFALIGLAVMLFRRRSRQRPPSVRRAAQVVLWSALTVWLFLLGLLANSLAFGTPWDLRHYMNPELAVRKDYPDAQIPPAPSLLKPEDGLDFIQRHKRAVGVEGEFRETTAIWDRWLIKGAFELGTKLLVYEYGPVQDYYKPFDATLVFPNKPQVRLAEGAVFMKWTDPSPHEMAYRQIPFWIDPNNMVGAPGQDLTRNALRGVLLNRNDSLMIVVKLVPLADWPQGRNLSEQFRTKLALAGR